MNTEQRVLDILRKESKNDLVSVETTTRLKELGLDSLALVVVVLRIESEFDITIPDDAVPNLVTVQDLIDLCSATH